MKTTPYHYRAIQVKHLGPTDTKGSRWKAWSVDRSPSVTIHANHGGNAFDNAQKAALEFVRMMDWDDENALLAGGSTSEGYVFVIVRVER